MSNQYTPGEKCCEMVKIKVTPTQLKDWREASNGNLSGWLKEIANERLPQKVTIKTNPRRAL